MNLQFGLLFIMSTLLTAITSNTRAAETSPTKADWKRVLGHAPFEPRDSAAELVFNNKMWIIGGYLPSLNDDVWSSSNGTDWEKVGSVGAKSGVNIPIQFVFQNFDFYSMIIIG